MVTATAHMQTHAYKTNLTELNQIIIKLSMASKGMCSVTLGKCN